MMFVRMMMAVLSLVTAGLFMPLQAAEEGLVPSQTIRVLLLENVPSAIVEAKGGYSLYNPKNGKNISIGGLFGKRYVAQPYGDGLKWGEIFPGLYQVVIHPDPQTTFLVNGIEYAGKLALFQVGDRITIVNEVDVDDYIKSTLAMQFDNSASEEVMAAIVIAARTDACYLVQRAPNADYQVKAADVGYEGVGVTRRGNGVDRAVDSTRPLVMLRNDSLGHPYFAARWTEDCAGKTASYQVIYRKDGNTPDKVVESPIAAAHRADVSWAWSVSKSELARLLSMDKVTAVEPYVNAPSGKIYAVQIRSGATTKSVDFLAFQQAVGADNLKSSDFKISMKGDTVTFNGFGKGTGVGLCLYSAKAMAARGRSATQILTTFFPETKVSSIIY